MSIEQAVSIVHSIINMQVNDIITKEQALAAIKKVPHYAEFFAA